MIINGHDSDNCMLLGEIKEVPMTYKNFNLIKSTTTIMIQ